MKLAEGSPYAHPRSVKGVADCLFYHTMDLPGVGLVEGPWDLRRAPGEYLGHLDVAGKRALDVGTASGFLAFEMERRGAEVVAYDLSDSSGGWDLVPFAGRSSPAQVAERSEGIGRINNGFWLAHAALGSRVRVAYGSIYDLSSQIGTVQVSVLGAVLLHLRDPFLALQRVLEVTSESVVVTEPAGRAARALGRLPTRVSRLVASSTLLPAKLGFLPHPGRALPDETWWTLTPWAVSRMLAVLGFELASVSFHSQLYQGRPCPMYTVVGCRAKGYAGALRSVRT